MMTTLRLISIGVFLAVLSACATVGEEVVTVPPLPPPPPPPPPPPAAEVGPQTVAVGELQFLDDPVPDSHAAFGYVVFTREPADAADRVRYLRTCRLFGTMLLTRRQIPRRFPEERMAVTYWPMAIARREAGTTVDCDRMVDDYNYFVGQQLASLFRLNNAEGPILIALTTPWTLNGNVALRPRILVNTSGLDDDVLDEIFDLWRGEIVNEPIDWRDLERIMTKVRIVQFIERVGPGVFSVISTFF